MSHFPLCCHTQRSLCRFPAYQESSRHFIVNTNVISSEQFLPCDLRKRAALIFLRDFRWCLLSLFGSVIRYFFLYCPGKKRNWTGFKLSFYDSKDKKRLNFNEWSAPMLHFLLCSFDNKRHTYYLLCNLFILQDRIILRIHLFTSVFFRSWYIILIVCTRTTAKCFSCMVPLTCNKRHGIAVPSPALLSTSL